MIVICGYLLPVIHFPDTEGDADQPFGIPL